MKQNISITDLNELSEKGQLVLCKWCLKNHYSVVKEDLSFYAEIPCVLLSIGQMIEFLDEEWGSWNMSSWQEWEVVMDEDNKIQYKITKKELVDALWEAVKEILEK